MIKVLYLLQILFLFLQETSRHICWLIVGRDHLLVTSQVVRRLSAAMRAFVVINWHTWVGGINWHTWVGGINWHTWVGGINWHTWVGGINWHTWVGGINCHTWVGGINWHTWVGGIGTFSLQWRHNGSDGVSNHQPNDCLLNRLFKVQIKENIKALPHWPLWWEFTGDWWIPHTKCQ